MMRPLALLAGLAGPAAAHEFWISPEAYTIAPGDDIRAALRNGEEFRGSSQVLLPSRAVQAGVQVGASLLPFGGRPGDRPAVTVSGAPEGLAVIYYQSTDSTVRYTEFDSFERFADHKGFPEAAERHLERGGTRDLVVEDYARYPKSLVAIGDGDGIDPEIGLEVEIVALANPYQGAEAIPVRVLRDGEAVPAKLVEIFEEAPDGTVAITETMTDADGVATVPVRPGYAYMLDSVFIDELDPPSESGATWRTLWANLTFAVPEEG